MPFLLPVSFPGLDWSQETVQWFAAGTNFITFDGTDEKALFERIYNAISECGLGIAPAGKSNLPLRHACRGRSARKH